MDVPVNHDGEDLIDIAARKHRSVEDVVRLHTSAEYTVIAQGSQPGFPYLGSLDERLAVPRRAEPHVRVEAGSVVVGGGQTGVISRTFPSSWHIIGRTEREQSHEAWHKPQRLSRTLERSERSAIAEIRAGERVG